VFRSSATSSLALLALLAAGCTAHAGTRPHYGGTLHVETQADPWQSPDSLGRRLVFDPLTRTDSTGTVQPALALRWQSQNNNHRWQFWLRPGVHFHDNAPLTADAVVQSLTHSCTHCPWSTLRRVGDSVVFTTDAPNPVLPAELARSLYAIASQDIDGNPTGTGPFKFVSDANDLLTLAAVDDAWQGRPFVDTIEIFGRRTLRTQWLDLAAGRADLADIPVESLHQAQQEHLTILQSPNCDLLALIFNPAAKPQDDAQREAISLAIDRAVLSNVIFQKQGEVTASLLPNNLTGYAFLFPTARNLPRAQELRSAANPAPLTLSIDDTNAAVSLAAERIALDLKDTGLRIQVLPHSTPPTSPPDLILRRIHLESANPQATLQQMLEAFNQSLTDDSPDPAALYREETAFAQTHQAVPLLYLPRAYAVGPRIHGLRLSADGLPQLADASLEDTK
jgi:peptide/nickel transport system substrate-binding protein